MSRIAQYLPVAALAGLAAAQVPGDHSFLFEDGLGDALGGLNDLPSTGHSIHQWNHGDVPDRCLETENCSVENFEVYDVNMDDCDVPFVVCRCNDSPTTIEQAANRLSRVPVEARQHVALTHIYGGDGGGALAILPFSDVHFFGGSGDSQTVYYHEIGHVLDWHVAPEDGFFSSGDEWESLVGQDSCVADNYASSSYTEAYAQAGVMAAYDVNVGPIGEVNDPSCMANQFNTARDQIGGTWQYQEGGFCTERPEIGGVSCNGAPCGQEKRRGVPQKHSKTKMIHFDADVKPVVVGDHFY